MICLLNQDSEIIMVWFSFTTGLKSKSPTASWVWVLMNKECSYLNIFVIISCIISKTKEFKSLRNDI